MAVVRGPLFSLSARKSVGKTITFKRFKGRSVLAKTPKPSNPKSGLQTGMRAMLRFTQQQYNGLTATAKANWKAKAKAKNITPANAQNSVNQINCRQNKGYVQDPTLTPGAAEAAPTGVVATPQPKSVSLVWVDSAGANDVGTFIYMSKTTGFTPDVSNLVRVIKHGAQAFVVAKLVTGTAYFFVLKGCEIGGTIGTAAAQVTATPT